MMPLDDAEEPRREGAGIGRPRPEDPDLMTARQLVSACQQARDPEGLSYAAAETEAFVESLGHDVGDAVLLELLGLPCRETVMQALVDLAEALADRAPAVVPAVYRIAAGRSPAARANAEMVLGRLRRADFAAGLVLVLQDDDSGHRLKESAAESLLALARTAPVVVLDALAEPEVRAWLVQVSGCSAQLTDAELMRCLVSGAR
jgi:hypothetical protein